MTNQGDSGKVEPQNIDTLREYVDGGDIMSDGGAVERCEGTWTVDGKFVRCSGIKGSHETINDCNCTEDEERLWQVIAAHEAAMRERDKHYVAMQTRAVQAERQLREAREELRRVDDELFNCQMREKTQSQLREAREELEQVVNEAVAAGGLNESTPNAVGQPVSTEPTPSQLVGGVVRQLSEQERVTAAITETNEALVGQLRESREECEALEADCELRCSCEFVTVTGELLKECTYHEAIRTRAEQAERKLKFYTDEIFIINPFPERWAVKDINDAVPVPDKTSIATLLKRHKQAERKLAEARGLLGEWSIYMRGSGVATTLHNRTKDWLTAERKEGGG